MSKLPYGYTMEQDGKVVADGNEALIVREIFECYLSGSSPGGIASILTERQIPSPSNNGRWNRTVIDNILSNGKYLFQIISTEQFFEVQHEKHRRSNMDYDTGERKTPVTIHRMYCVVFSLR